MAERLPPGFTRDARGRVFDPTGRQVELRPVQEVPREIPRTREPERQVPRQFENNRNEPFRGIQPPHVAGMRQPDARGRFEPEPYYREEDRNIGYNGQQRSIDRSFMPQGNGYQNFQPSYDNVPYTQAARENRPVEYNYASELGHQRQRTPPMTLIGPAALKSSRAGGAPYNDYFLPGEGIDREVITYDICKFLGQDATVKPAEYQGVQGYKINAYRALTSEMIKTLQERSGGYKRSRDNALRESRQQPSYGEYYYAEVQPDYDMMDAEPTSQYENRFQPQAPRMDDARPRMEEPRQRGPANMPPFSQESYETIRPGVPPGFMAENNPRDNGRFPGNQTPPGTGAARAGNNFAASGFPTAAPFSPQEQPRVTSSAPPVTTAYDARGRPAQAPESNIAAPRTQQKRARGE